MRRIFYSDNGVLTDKTVDLNNYYSGTLTFSYIAGEDYFYIGSYLPFNHLYFKLATPSSATSTMTVSYYSNSSWVDAVNLLDETNGFKNSGFVTWTPNKNYNWTRKATNYGGETVSGLTTVEIYDLYWLRIKFSNDLTASSIISWIGNIFSDDNDLGSEHNNLNRTAVKTAYQTGKTDWQEQCVKAGEIIERDLIAKRRVDSVDQILKKEELRLASVSKVAELIYSQLGDDYEDQRNLARKEYELRLNTYLLTIDQNCNGLVELYETKFKTGRMYR